MLTRIRRWLQRERVDLRSVDPQFLRRAFVCRDWSGNTFSNFVPVGCHFKQCTFENVMFQHACFGGGREDTIYERCSFDRSTIYAPAVGRSRFIECTFRSADIQYLNSFNAEFVNCTFSGILRKASFRGSILPDVARGMERSRNRFEGNDFSEAQFVDVWFEDDIDLQSQKLPEGWSNEA